MGVHERADVCGQLRVLLFATQPTSRDEILETAHPLTGLVQSLQNRFSSPPEASFGLAGAAFTEFRGHLGHKQPALVYDERSATTGSGAASGQRMPFPDYVSAQGPVPTPWTQVGPVVFSRLRRAAPGDLQRPCGCAWSNSGRMVENVSRRARSVDVFQQGRFLFPCQPLTSPLPKEQVTSYQGPALFQGSFTIIITRLLMPLRWLNGTG